jgi:hypothetical protein
MAGSETNETALFNQRWAKANVQAFTNADDLEAWRVNRSQDRKPVAKVIYDRSAGEVRVWIFGLGKGFSKTIDVERDLATALQEADRFIREQTQR